MSIQSHEPSGSVLEAQEGRRGELEALVAGHRRRFDWYDALVGCGPPARDRREGTRLADLPIIDERVLLEHYYTATHDQLPDAEAFQTSGTSSGRRKTILYSKADDAAYCAQRAELFGDFLNDIPRGSVAVSDVGTGHAAASAHTIFRKIGLDPHEIDFRRPIEEHIELLNRTQPAVLFTMPVILERLLACGDELDIHPRKVIVVGDVAPENWRRHVASELGIEADDVLDIVGSIEIGAIAWHCAETGLYHFHDHILPEAVEPGELFPECAGALAADQGLLLLTSLAREYFPAVRYATNDVVKGLRRMQWQGRTIFVCEQFQGRFAGEVKHGERLSSYDICTAVNEAFPGCLFEVIEDSGVEIRIVTPHVTPEQQAQITDFLMTANPDIGDMVRSGLTRPIAVSAISPDELRASRGKRVFHGESSA